MKNWEILDPDLNIDEVYSFIKKYNHPIFSKYWLEGYYLEAFALYNPLRIRCISGLDGLSIISDEKITITFKKDLSFFALLVLNIDYTNFAEQILQIKINSKVYTQIGIYEYLSIMQDKNEIEYTFKDKRNVKECSSTLYYLVSPYRHDAYYLDLGIECWKRATSDEKIN